MAKAPTKTAQPANTAAAPEPVQEVTETKSTAVVPAPAAGGVSDGVPDYLQGSAGGSQLQGIDNSDIALPSIRLLQATSEAVTMFDVARAGIFWHTGFDMPLGSDLDFIICANRKKYMLMAPPNDPRKVLARSDDGIHWVPPNGVFEVRLKNVKKPVVWETKPTVAASGLAEYGTFNPEDPDSPPAAVLMYEHLVILPEFAELGPAFFTFARSQIRKVRRELYPKVALHGNHGRPMQALRFRASVVEDKGPEGPFFNVTFSSAGWATKQQFDLACSMQEKFDRMRPRDPDPVDDVDMGGRGATSGDGPKEY
jgi:hypothetical protein